jgi:hypothetical protein
VVPCIFKYSIKHPTRCTINYIFTALSRRYPSTCFGPCCAHHPEPPPPPPTAFAASGYRIIAGLDVFQAVVGLLLCPSSGAPPTAFAASGYRIIAGLDVFQAVVGLLLCPSSGAPSNCLCSIWLPYVQPGNHTVTRGCKGSWRGLLMMMIIIIIFINCSWVVTQWQWSFYIV